MMRGSLRYSSGLSLRLKAFETENDSQDRFPERNALRRFSSGPPLMLRAFVARKGPLDLFVCYANRSSPTHIESSECSHIHDVGIFCAKRHDLNGTIKPHEQRSDDR